MPAHLLESTLDELIMQQLDVLSERGRGDACDDGGDRGGVGEAERGASIIPPSPHAHALVFLHGRRRRHGDDRAEGGAGEGVVQRLEVCAGKRVVARAESGWGEVGGRGEVGLVESCEHRVVRRVQGGAECTVFGLGGVRGGGAKVVVSRDSLGFAVVAAFEGVEGRREVVSSRLGERGWFDFQLSMLFVSILFKGRRNAISTRDVTANPRYEFIIQTTNRIREHLLKEEQLRRPFLDLFLAVHKDDSAFPDGLKDSTPVEDQKSNQSKIQEVRNKLPTDADVLDFLTNAFPDIYLVPGGLSAGEHWGYTSAGRGEVDKEYVSIIHFIVELWEQSEMGDQAFWSRLTFIYVAVLLHEVAHSALLWYSRGACDSLQLGGINREAGYFIEKRLWGGIVGVEVENSTMHLMDVGITSDGTFLFIDQAAADSVIEFNVAKGLPFLDISVLSSAPPITVGRSRFKLSSAVASSTTIFRHLNPAPKLPKGHTRRPLLKNDKIRVMPSV
ncbi:hypothetical protein EW146_g9110 [Bondarzewia mesenterica]|uniref:Uncharacterized protein n=1 Tax=Bondarzewia mesenterica TaxID=1095465 RepID=A0A4S4LAX1_9AGAM|nr:hypothetical protein EW146_g9110 [Bondarzewia mesenterica]